MLATGNKFGAVWTGTITVYALDAYYNLVTNYTGTVHFSSTDTQAGLPPDSHLSNGTGQFTVTLNLAGIQYALGDLAER